MHKLTTVTLTGTLLFATSAHAHIDIMSHDSRPGGNQKVGPCEGVPRGSSVYTYEPGETITLEISETIPHPGWFRVAFDDDGEDDLLPPASIDPPAYYVNDAVLMDELDKHDQRGLGGTHTWSVTLPDVECDNCTLQVIQVMLDKLPYDPNETDFIFSNDLYFRCIDVVLKRSDSAPDPATDPASAMEPTPEGGEPTTDPAGNGMPGADSGMMEGGAAAPSEPASPSMDTGVSPGQPSPADPAVDMMTAPTPGPAAAPAPAAPAPAAPAGMAPVSAVDPALAAGMMASGLSPVQPQPVAAAPVAASSEDSGGCSASGGRSSTSPWLTVGGLVGLWLMRSRRRGRA